MSHACHRFWKCYKTFTFCSLLTRCTIPCACPAKRRFNVQKWTSMKCFVHVDLEMCFAPQRRALFRHLNRSHFGSRYTLCSCCKAGLLPFYFFHVATHGTLTQLRPQILLSPVCCFEGPRDKYLFAAHRLFKTYAAPWKNKKKNNSRCSTCWKLVALQGLLTETEPTQGQSAKSSS